MQSPSWLPTWPSNWPDIVARYVDTVPRAWPKRMFRRGGKVFADLQAFGEALSAPRQLAEWALRTFLPPADTEGLWLHLWEKDFGIEAAATIAQRQARLAMRARLLNQSSAEDVIRAVFAEVFSTTPENISISHAAPADVAAAQTLGSVTHARAHNSYHVYPTSEDTDPNLDLGRTAVLELEPAVGRITFGRYKKCKYRRSTYRRACYSRST